jgi:transposase
VPRGLLKGGRPMEVYCGIDLHSRRSQVCVIDGDGKVLVNRKVPNRIEDILRVLEPFGKGIPVAVESTFNWYWLVDGLQDAGHEVHLGHPLKLAMISKAKTKTDRVDAFKLARLLRWGDFPEAFIYPRETRPIRDLIRHRGKLVTWRAREHSALRLRLYRHGFLDHDRNSAKSMSEDELESYFSDARTRHLLRLERDRIRLLSAQIAGLDAAIIDATNEETGLERLRRVPGIGLALAPVVFYESGDICRFASAKHYSSYARVVAGCAESDGTSKAPRGRKQGNAHLKSAFSQAAVHAARCDERVRRFRDRHLSHRRGKGAKPIANAIVAHKLAVAVYHVLRHGKEFKHELIFGN